jgi:hypothetical protein
LIESNDACFAAAVGYGHTRLARSDHGVPTEPMTGGISDPFSLISFLDFAMITTHFLLLLIRFQ